MCSDGEYGVMCEVVLIGVVVGKGLLVCFLSNCFVGIIRHEYTKAFVPLFTCSEDNVFDDVPMWLGSTNFEDSSDLFIWCAFVDGSGCFLCNDE